MRTKIKLFNKDYAPTKGSEQAAGYDLYAYIPDGRTIIIPPHKTEKISAGFCMQLQEGYAGFIYARSGLATKQGLRPANCVGVIDSDYRGEIIVALHNDSIEPKIIRNKDRIAQLIIQQVPYTMIEYVDKLDDTERGAGGFGSTGT